LIPHDLYHVFDQITESNIVGKGTDINEEDFIVDFTTMNYAMKEKNPVDNVHFYTRWNGSDSFLIPKKNVSLLIPDQFSERYIRIFATDTNKTKEIQDSFRKLLRSMNCSPGPAHSLPSTPSQSPEKNVSTIERNFIQIIPRWLFGTET